MLFYLSFVQINLCPKSLIILAAFAKLSSSYRTSPFIVTASVLNIPFFILGDPA